MTAPTFADAVAAATKLMEAARGVRAAGTPIDMLAVIHEDGTASVGNVPGFLPERARPMFVRDVTRQMGAYAALLIGDSIRLLAKPEPGEDPDALLARMTAGFQLGDPTVTRALTGILSTPWGDAYFHADIAADGSVGPLVTRHGTPADGGQLAGILRVDGRAPDLEA